MASADLVITGARVRCATDRWAASIAIRGDRVVALDSAAEELITARTRVIHAPGGLVLPGFQDAHVHPVFAGRNQLRVWLNDTAGRPGYLEAIGAYAAAHPDEPWVIGGGWAMEHFPGGGPRREDLDAVVPDRPVFLFNRDVHGAWVNSRALEIGGITANTPDPGDGRIERDPDTGEPSGTLHEGAAYAFNDRFVPAPGAGEWAAALRAGQAHLHRLGITGWQDAWVTPDTLAAYRGAAMDGSLTARVVGALWWDRYRGMEQVADFVEQRKLTTGTFHATTVKIMMDGVLENFTGGLLEPYCDGCGGTTSNYGLSYLEPELLEAAVTELHRLDFQVHLHAIGDRAVQSCLNAIEAAQARHGRADQRHHIAHVQLVHPDDIARFASLGVVANCQTFWAQREPQMDELTIPYLGAQRADRQYPFADLQRAGARLAMGSDWSVTTADPLQQLEVAVTRIDPSRRGSPSFLPDQRLSLSSAVDAFTVGSAFVNHDDDAGTLAIGRRADLALLSHDIFAPGFAGPDAAPIADARVELTVASGRVVYDPQLR